MVVVVVNPLHTSPTVSPLPNMTLSKTDYNEKTIPGNGWCYYLAVLTGINPKVTPTNQDALNLATEISDNLKGQLDSEGADGPLHMSIDALLTSNMAEAKAANIKLRTEIEDNTSLSAADKQTMIENIIDPVHITIEEYINKLTTPVNANNLDAGPQEWPNADMIGNTTCDIKGIQIFIYDKDQTYTATNIYPNINGDTTRPVIKLLFLKGGNHFDLLVEKTKVGKVATALQSAKQSILGGLSTGITAAKNFIKTGAYGGEILVTGERVRIDETGFDERRVAGTVSFTRAYFPEAEGVALENAKATFSMIFNNKTEADVDQLLPPCDIAERTILLQGLGNRLQTLFDEIRNIRMNNGDIVILRTKLEQYQRLEILINELKRRTIEGECQEYNADGSSAGMSEINLADEEEYRNLLRHFAFMVLQAKMPIKGYHSNSIGEGITNGDILDSESLISTLKTMPIDKEEVDTYLTLWREQALDAGQSVPTIIAEVLDGTITQPGMLSTLLEDQLTALYTDIITKVRAEYATNPALLTAFNRYVVTTNKIVGNTKGKITQILRWIATQNKKTWGELGAVQAHPLVSDAEMAGAKATFVGDMKNTIDISINGKGIRLSVNDCIEVIRLKAPTILKILGFESSNAHTYVDSILYLPWRNGPEAKWGPVTDPPRAIGLDPSNIKLDDVDWKSIVKVDKCPVEGTRTDATVATGGGAPPDVEITDLRTKLVKAEGAAAAALAAQQAAEQVLYMAQQQAHIIQTQNMTLNNTNQSLQADMAAAKAAATEAGAAAAKGQLQTSLHVEAANKDFLIQAAADVAALAAKATDLDQQLATANDSITKANAAAAAAAAEAATARAAAVTEIKALAADGDATAAAADMQAIDAAKAHANLAEELRLSKAKQAAAESEAAAIAADLSFVEIDAAAAKKAAADAVADRDATVTILQGEITELINNDIAQLTKAKTAAETIATQASTQVQGIQGQLQAAQQGATNSDTMMTNMLNEIQTMATKVLAGEPVTIPAGLTPQAGNAFNALLTNIQKLKTTPVNTVSNNICFLSYFIAFFMKVLFFSTDNTPRRQAVLSALDSISIKLVADLKGDKTEKDTLYMIIKSIFSLINASETLFLNKQEHDGKTDYIGLNVIKLDNPDTTKVISAIYDAFKLQPALPAEILFIETALLSTMTVTLPSIYFNKPLDGMTDANFTYLPKRETELKNPTLQKRYQYIDVVNNFARTEIPLTNDKWGPIAAALNDITLRYSSMFALFITLGRRYLIAAKGDLALNKCALPKILDDKSSMRAM